MNLQIGWRSVFIVLIGASLVVAEDDFRRLTRLTDFVATTTETAPSYSAPYIVQHSGYAQTSAEAEVRLVHEQTGKKVNLNVWPPEPTVAISIKRIIVLPDQSIVAGLRLISPENQRAEVISIFNATGERKSWFRTNPYAWNDFAVDDDGSLWMFGYCPDYLAAQCGLDYPLVRHYSLTGDLREGFLSPRDFLPPGSLNKPRSANSWIAVRHDFIALFVSGTSEWLRLDKKGKILERYPVSLPDFGDRFALSPEGKLLLGGSGIGRLLEFDADGTVAERPEYQGYLLGSNGDTIVLADFEMGAKTRVTYVSPRVNGRGN